MNSTARTWGFEGQQSPGKRAENPSKSASQAMHRAPKWAPLHPGACPASTALGAKLCANAPGVRGAQAPDWSPTWASQSLPPGGMSGLRPDALDAPKPGKVLTTGA